MSDLNDCYAGIGRITVKMKAVAHLLLLCLLEHENQGRLKLNVNLDKWAVKQLNEKFRRYLDAREQSGESLPHSRRWSENLDDAIRKRNNYVHSLRVMQKPPAGIPRPASAQVRGPLSILIAGSA